MPISDKLPLTEKDKHSHLQARGKIINNEKETREKERVCEREKIVQDARYISSYDYVTRSLCVMAHLNSFTLRMEKSTEANKGLMYLLAFWRAVGHNTPYGNPCHRSHRRASRPESTRAHTQRSSSDTQKIRRNIHYTSKQHLAVSVRTQAVLWHYKGCQQELGQGHQCIWKELTAFFPWIWQELHVLHSMHCHRRALTFAVKSVENFRHDGWPLRRNVE